jgi:hypothetical protein
LNDRRIGVRRLCLFAAIPAVLHATTFCVFCAFLWAISFARFYRSRTRQTNAEIAALIGDKTGPAIIAHTYGDVRPDHLLAQAQRIRLTVAVPAAS